MTADKAYRTPVSRAAGLAAELGSALVLELGEDKLGELVDELGRIVADRLAKQISDSLFRVPGEPIVELCSHGRMSWHSPPIDITGRFQVQAEMLPGHHPQVELSLYDWADRRTVWKAVLHP